MREELQINLETEGDTVRRVQIFKGCDGNTSCPDQMAKALKQL